MALLVAVMIVIGGVAILLIIAGTIGTWMGKRDAERLPPNNRTVGGTDPEERL